MLPESAIWTSGACTILRYDNLRLSMRDVYYRLLVNGLRPTAIVTTPMILAAYEGLQISEPDPTSIVAAPLTFFKDCPMSVGDVPEDELHFLRNGVVVGAVRHIS